MELGIVERLALLEVLPKEGVNFLTLRIVHELRESLSFSEGEIKEKGLAQEGGQITWLRDADVPTDIPIGEKATEVIQEALKSWDEQERLAERHFSICKKFLEE